MTIKNNCLLLFLFFITAFLSSCDGGDGAYIFNNSRDTISITVRQTLKDNGSGLAFDTLPRKVRPLELRLDKSGKEDDYKRLGDYAITFDSAANAATFTLLPNDKVEIGITFLQSRDDYHAWEFNEMEATFRDGSISLKNKGIPDFAVKEKHWWGYPDYYIVFGHKN